MGLLAFGFMYWMVHRKAGLKWMAIAAVTVSMLGIYFVYRGLLEGNLAWLERPFAGFQFSRNFGLTSEDILNRWAYYLNGLLIVRDHVLSGIGPGAFSVVYPQYHDAWVATPRDSYDIGRRPVHAHNDFLEAFVELGIPGGILYLAMFVCAVGYVLRAGADPDHPHRTRILLLGASLITLATNALMDMPLQYPTAPATAAILMGAIASEHIQRAYRTTPIWPSLRLRPAVAAGLAGAAGILWVLCLIDDWNLRHAHVLLKQGVFRTIETGGDEEEPEIGG